MSNLKRKDAPGGNPPAKSAKGSKAARPTNKDAPIKNAKASDKPVRKSTSDELSKAPTVSLLKTEEPAFPRGGGSVLTPLEQKQIQIEAKADAMREEEFETSGKALKKKKRKSAAAKADRKSDNKEEVDSVKVESLNFKVFIRMGRITVVDYLANANAITETGQRLAGARSGHSGQQP